MKFFPKLRLCKEHAEELHQRYGKRAKELDEGSDFSPRCCDVEVSGKDCKNPAVAFIFMEVVPSDFYQNAMAVAGAVGGSKISEAKAVTARANGAKGGRPRKPKSGV